MLTGSRQHENMCQKIEDCLLSKIGFRIFISVVFVIIIIAFILNFQFLTSSKHTTDIGNEVFRKIKDLQKDERKPSNRFSNNKQDHSNSVNTHVGRKTKILIWMTNFNEPESFESPFYSEFSHRVRQLRHKKCPILKECAFASHRDKLYKADAVVIVREEHTSSKEDNLFNTGSKKEHTILDNTFLYESKSQNINKSKMKDKIWALLVKNPFDQRQMGNASKFLKRRFGVEKFDYFITYMPNADIPLLRYSLSPRLLSHKVHKKFKTTNRLLSPFGSRSVASSIEYFSESNVIRRDTTAQKLKPTNSRLTNHTPRRGISTLNDGLILQHRKRNSTDGKIHFMDKEFAQRKKHKKYKLNNLKDEYKVNDVKSNYKQYHEDGNLSNVHEAPHSYIFDHERERPIISDRNKRGHIGTTAYSNVRRLAAVIMNVCISEGNREGKFL